MTLEEFRIKHSEIIEQYQLVEHHLEGIFALIANGDFEELAHRVENDTMGELIRKVRFMVKENNIGLIDKNDFSVLEEIRDERNYWCHQCYLDIKKSGNESINIYKRINIELIKVKNMNLKLRDVFKKLSY